MDACVKGGAAQEAVALFLHMFKEQRALHARHALPSVDALAPSTFPTTATKTTTTTFYASRFPPSASSFGGIGRDDDDDATWVEALKAAVAKGATSPLLSKFPRAANVLPDGLSYRILIEALDGRTDGPTDPQLRTGPAAQQLPQLAAATYLRGLREGHFSLFGIADLSTAVLASSLAAAPVRSLVCGGLGGGLSVSAAPSGADLLWLPPKFALVDLHRHSVAQAKAAFRAALTLVAAHVLIEARLAVTAGGAGGRGLSGDGDGASVDRPSPAAARKETADKLPADQPDESFGGKPSADMTAFHRRLLLERLVGGGGLLVVTGHGRSRPDEALLPKVRLAHRSAASPFPIAEC
jgi:hypothetical protein